MRRRRGARNKTNFAHTQFYKLRLSGQRGSNPRSQIESLPSWPLDDGPCFLLVLKIERRSALIQLNPLLRRSKALLNQRLERSFEGGRSNLHKAAAGFANLF